jgi:hypothetical protein
MHHLRHRRRPPAAMVVSTIALFIALGGTSLAAVKVLVPKNSVGSAQVINGSLAKSDLARSTINALKGSRGPQGDQGSAGSQGSAGPAGATGPAGAAGAAGAPGQKGDAGSPGAKGDVGATGPAGATGPEGPAGVLTSGMASSTANFPAFSSVAFFFAGTFTPSVSGSCLVTGSAQFTAAAEATAGPSFRIAVARGDPPGTPVPDGSDGHAFPPFSSGRSDDLTRSSIMNVNAGQVTRFGLWYDGVDANWQGDSWTHRLTWVCFTPVSASGTSGPSLMVPMD